MKELKIAIIQSSLYWEQKAKNLESFQEKILAVPSEVDLIVLPETFTTGFVLKNAAQLAEAMDGPSINWMKNMALKANAVICGSLIISENNLLYNRMVWVKPDGELEIYNKRHLFRLAYEQNYFAPGNTKKIVELHGWNISLNICYDLRFPVWCRNVQNEYDLALFVANWPESRIEHWNSLLQARAIENLAYIIGCNRIGEDGTGKNHTGCSQIISPKGKVELISKKEETLIFSLSKSMLDSTRMGFQFYKDADNFKIMP